VILLALTLTAPAQNTPHIGYAYPAGGRQGTTIQVTLGGQFLSGVTNASVHFSGDGVQAAVVDYTRPPTQKEINDLRQKLMELQDKRAAAQTSARGSTNVAWTAADQRMLVETRQKLAVFQRRPMNPAISETAVLRLTVATNAEPGERELRVLTPAGLSNPLRFWVGQLPEFRKTETKTSDNPAGLRAFRNNKPKATPPTEMNITLPAVVNGQILPGGVDRYRFQARQGQHLVAAVSARELIPYLPDAVPGWFQAALSLYDARGNELAYADHFRFHPDPVVHFEVPRDGEYVIQIRDSIYRGREDFVYRITVGEVPYVTSIFPLGAPSGAQTAVEMTGWNLPAKTLISTNREPGIYPLFARTGKWISNPMPIAVDTLPECLEQEPNDSQESAQPVTLPIIVNGRIDHPGDWDVFRFRGRAGEEIVAEVYARRLDSPLDSVIKLTDAGGRQLAFNDDHEDKGAGLDTHYADSYLRVTLPSDGTWYLHLGDAQHQGGPEYAYRLRISAPRPDFALRVVPSSVNVRGGASVPITVYALRRDGFSNEIAVALSGAPEGFTLGGGTVPANLDKVRITLTAPPMPTNDPVCLSLKGRAIIQGREVVHPAVPAEDMMQAFAYRHLVPAKELEVAVTGRFMPRNSVRLLGEMPVKIPANGTARVRFATPSGAFAGRFQFELSEPPEGITIGNVSPAGAGVEIELRSDAAKVKPGLKGNLIVNLYPVQVPPAAQKAKAPANVRRPAASTLPAIPFEIVASSSPR
jgi:hypothetical protein